ncbi:MAG: serine hydrolase domain-containing protein [Chloroflexota bacterium]|nr:serine hydrolase domain-containing protein [Chloroflexota bacterium]
MLGQQLIDRIMGVSQISRELDTLVAAYTKQGRFSGAVLVAQHGDILLSKGYGYADQDHDWQSNTPRTLFRIGSMSKPFTAIAMMQLVEQGQLSLGDTLSTLLPDYPQGERITIAHLLSNRSGIEDYVTTTEYERIQSARLSTQELTGLFRDQPLRFAPGSNFGYSNSNWVLLALIVEQVTGQPFERVIRERVLLPAGMRASGLDWSSVRGGRSVGYIDTGAGMERAPLLDSSTMRGGGDIHSTIEDLYQWDRALYTDTLLPQATLRQMWTPLTELNGKGYGLGFERHTLHGHRSVGHSGGLPGYVSNIARFIDDDATIILVSNLGSAAWEQITDGLAAILFGAPYTLPTKKTFVKVDPAVLTAYVGTYTMEYFERTAELRFTIEPDGLVMHTNGLPKAVLSALSDTRFYGRSKGEVEFAFVREHDGQVNRIDIVWAGYKLAAQRK